MLSKENLARITYLMRVINLYEQAVIWNYKTLLESILQKRIFFLDYSEKLDFIEVLYGSENLSGLY